MQKNNTRAWLFFHVHNHKFRVPKKKQACRKTENGGGIFTSTEHHHHQLTFHPTSAKTHTNVRPTKSAAPCAFSPPFFLLFVAVMSERESPSYLPHPGHSYFYADNGGALVFVSPTAPFTASVSKHIYSRMYHRRRLYGYMRGYAAP